MQQLIYCLGVVFLFILVKDFLFCKPDVGLMKSNFHCFSLDCWCCFLASVCKTKLDFLLWFSGSPVNVLWLFWSMSRTSVYSFDSWVHWFQNICIILMVSFCHIPLKVTINYSDPHLNITYELHVSMCARLKSVHWKFAMLSSQFCAIFDL